MTQPDTTPTDPTPTDTSPTTKHDQDRAPAGDRGDASGRNIAQNRAIGQGDPARDAPASEKAHAGNAKPGTTDIGTEAAQTAEAERLAKE